MTSALRKPPTPSIKRLAMSKAAFTKLVLETANAMWANGFTTDCIARQLMNLHPGLWRTRAACEADVSRALAEQREATRL